MNFFSQWALPKLVVHYTEAASIWKQISHNCMLPLEYHFWMELVETEKGSPIEGLHATPEFEIAMLKKGALCIPTTKSI